MSDSYLITGGAGFIGSNVADFYLSRKKRVVIFDNFSRAGAEPNVEWLRDRHGDGLIVIEGDVRRQDRRLSRAVEESEVVFHLAGQVAVTTSVDHPREDFEVNALGAFNVLEAVRASSSKPVVVYSSTNKVYGKMADLKIQATEGRYAYAGEHDGISESRPLDFHSPYGCSKGAGDQYVLDYARIYGLKTVVFRQSCIYGPRQFGLEDQGWVAWFAIRALQGLPVVIYGDGRQVRDVLWVGDLIAAYDSAIRNIDRTCGQAYNIGGGPRNTLSILELVSLLEGRFSRPLAHSFEDWRPGDQLVFISDIRKSKADFDWAPRVGVEAGIGKLVDWLRQNSGLFTKPAESARLVMKA